VSRVRPLASHYDVLVRVGAAVSSIGYSRVGKKRVGRLMRQAGLSGLVRRRRGKTTIRVPGVDPPA
jgi:HTH-like domain